MLLQVWSTRGRTTVPVKLRGTLHWLFRSRVTVRIHLIQEWANVMFVPHVVESTP